MATADVSEAEKGLDKPVTERLLSRIAHRLYPQYLFKFATTQLAIEDAKYYHVTDGTDNNPWQRCFNVSSTCHKIRTNVLIMCDYRRMK